MADTNWRDRAACRGVDPELFFPTATSGPAYEAQVATAKAVCAGCPVRAACLAEAMESIPEGIAGGLTEQERRRQTRLDLVRESATIGRRLVAGGLSPRVAAGRCGVSVRTAQRWAASLRQTATAGAVS
jgi:hypothetical protein